MKIVSISSQQIWTINQKRRFQKIGHFIEFDTKKANTDKVIKMIGDAEILVVGSSGVECINAFVLENCSNLKYITVLGTGADFVDIEKASQLGIKVSNLKGANSESVAEHLWGLILALSKRIVESHNGAKNGQYEFFYYYGYELKNKTIGIVGFGNIGSKVARIAKAFEMKIFTYTNNLPQIKGVQKVNINELFKKSDVIVITIPLTPETENLISNEKFNLMKDDVILVSSSRESIINKKDLLEALKDHKLFGFGFELDINTKPDPVFYNYPNVIATPHNAFFTREADIKSNNLAVENVEKFVMGKSQNLLN